MLLHLLKRLIVRLISLESRSSPSRRVIDKLIFPLERSQNLFANARIDQACSEDSDGPAERSGELTCGRADPVRRMRERFADEGEDGGFVISDGYPSGLMLERQSC